MLTAYRNRKAARNANKIKKPVSVELDPVTIPELFRCPISHELMKDPVILSTGISYDRNNIEKWIYEDGNHTCPVTGVALTSLEPVPNHTIRRLIQDWCVENKSYGFDRIPTPRASASSAQVNAVLVLKELLSSDHEKLHEFAKIEGSIETLATLVRKPIDSTTTNASLLAIYHLVTPSTCFNQKKLLISRFHALGLTQKLIEMLVDCTRSVCEKALGVLDGLCSIDEALESAYNNALTVPVLVKKLLRVSDIATEFSVSILWKLSKYEKSVGDDESLAKEALQVGAFQKLVLLLQVGCCLETKEKAGDLLKRWNLVRGRVECIESMDFENLKRSF
ncbi:hypothetical protein E3N88_45102 [Mikania micrantha]|uniref:U-box domain-containing protein n=1 Tax=Mikania micrantha TaxID=192012 RepID=A0A5N6LA45_9ASTR|nr:hypothetical protein E3N88_45102 [Mikania micrantha]